MIRIYTVFAVIFYCCFSPLILNAQTGGGSYISSIESKADRILSLLNNIEKAKQDNIKLQQQAEEAKRAAQKKLDDKLKEIEESESWKNRRKTAQSGWEEYSPGTCSAGGPPPICPANHWKRVSVSQAMEKYNAYKKSVLQPFEKAVAEAGVSQTKKIDENKKKIKENDDEIERLKREMVRDSRLYKEAVVKAAFNYRQGHIRQLMEAVADKHAQEDRVDIYDIKIKDLAGEEAKTVAEMENKISRLIEDEMAKLKNKSFELNTNATALGNEITTRKLQSDRLLSQLKSRLYNVNNSLRDTSKLAPGEYQKLMGEKTQLEVQIQKEENDFSNYKTATENKIASMKTNAKAMDDKAWDYQVNKSKLIAEGVQHLRDAYANKRKILQQGKNAGLIRLKDKGEVLQAKQAAVRSLLMKWAQQVDSERVRLLRACQKVGVGCFGADTYGDVVGSFNTALGCVNEMESHKSIGVVYGCTEESAYYQNHYAFLRGNLSNSDADALSRSSRKTRYDLILNKISN